MHARQLIIAAALAAATFGTFGATVRADEGEHRQELHRVRHRVPVVIDRPTTLNRLDRLLEGIEEIDALTPVVVSIRPRGHVIGVVGRLRADGDDDREALRSRGGEEPGARSPLHRPRPTVVTRSIEQRLDEMRREVVALRREVLRAPEVERVRRQVPIVMHDDAFRIFVRNIRRAPFAREKVEVIRDVVAYAHFTTAQAEIVVRAVEPWGQVAAAVALHPRIVDPESFHVVIGALTFSSDRDELRRRIRRR